MKRSLLPFLLAIAPILFLYSHNIEEVSPIHLLLPMSIAIVGTSILLFVLKLAIKDFNKAILITSLFWILFFSFGRARSLVCYLLISQEISDSLIGLILFPIYPVWILFLGIGTLLIAKSHRDFSVTTKFLTIMAVVLIIIPLINIGIHGVRVINLASKIPQEELPRGDLQNLDTPPDIYYIILDRYGREDALKEFFDYDNKEFINYLTSKGFYVASNSSCNYLTTLPSLASSLNMRYLDSAEVEDTLVLLRIIQDNEASRFLKTLGYRYTHVSSNGLGDGIEKYAKMYKLTSKLWTSTFAASLLRTTILAPLAFQLVDADQRDKILYSFDILSNIPNYEEPNFVLAHIMCPHGPFIFDQDGNPPRRGEGTYIDQLIFTNKQVEIIIDNLLQRPNPPIIILQGDTGQAPTRSGGVDRQTWWIENGGLDILNAYYLPGEGLPPLYESISPVNTFRVIFNSYFGTNYELLEDK